MTNSEHFNRVASAHPPLPLEEELAICDIISDQECAGVDREEAIERLVKHNLCHALKMARSFMQKWSLGGNHFDDALAIAVAGLFEAARRARNEGVPFIAFAYHVIRGRLLEFKRSIPVVVASKYAHQISSKKCSKTRKAVEASRFSLSFDGIASCDDGTEIDESSFHEIIPDSSVNVAAAVETSLDLAAALKILPERDRKIVSCAYGIDCAPMSLVEISHAFGISPQRAGQVCSSALQLMRNFLCGQSETDCYHDSSSAA